MLNGVRQEDVNGDLDDEAVSCREAIFQLLLAAGYFRARIKGLSHFDKLVGGLIWCLDHCRGDDDGADDVDMVFDEDLSIGQKIALTEKIVRVAVRAPLKCPHPIQPHQIQGLDYVAVLPVVQWLVKKVVEIRREMGDQSRRYALAQYKKSEDTIEQEQGEGDTRHRHEALDELLGIYQPRRRYRQLPGAEASEEDAATRVDLTLLEYGQRKSLASEKKSESQGDYESRTTTASAAEQGLAEVTPRIDAQQVSQLLQSSSSELSQAAEQFQALQAQWQEQQAEQTPQGLVRSIETTRSHAQAVTAKTEAIRAERVLLEASWEALRGRVDVLEAEEVELERALRAAGADTAEDEAVLREMQELMRRNEKLKRQEAEFKARCKDQLAELEKRNEVVREQVVGREGRVKDASQLDRQAKEAEEKLSELRTRLADKTRLTDQLERRLDDVPSSWELGQYQHRFVELNQQMASEYTQTQQFYTLFNTLQAQKAYMEREVGLMSAAREAVPTTNGRAASTAAQKEQFLERLRAMLTETSDALGKVRVALAEEEARRLGVSRQLAELLESHRSYTLLVRDMREEMRKNALLAQKIELLEQ